MNLSEAPEAFFKNHELQLIQDVLQKYHFTHSQKKFFLEYLWIFKIQKEKKINDILTFYLSYITKLTNISDKIKIKKLLTIMQKDLSQIHSLNI